MSSPQPPVHVPALGRTSPVAKSRPVIVGRPVRCTCPCHGGLCSSRPSRQRTLNVLPVGVGPGRYWPSVHTCGGQTLVSVSPAGHVKSCTSSGEYALVVISGCPSGASSQ